MNFFSSLYKFLGLDTLFRSNSNKSTSDHRMRGKTAVDPESYWQGRNRTFADELTFEVKQNANDLMKRVNLLLAELNVVSAKVVSGWRPEEVNARIGGAPRSYHITGQAVDLRDNANQEFAKLLIDNNHLLHKYQLWLENPQFTRGQNTNWIHLDIGTRRDRELRVFNP